MPISFLTITTLLALVSATPANKLFIRHGECEYSGITGGVRYTGVCTFFMNREDL
ncbi:hypothetical protein F4776DRAFT_604121 [Hypoxylon sp. NC0597]|nr:hypothetical protein F4776DRAFT_604121 [Hypoxylon sp. NC0597]